MPARVIEYPRPNVSCGTDDSISTTLNGATSFILNVAGASALVLVRVTVLK